MENRPSKKEFFDALYWDNRDRITNQKVRDRDEDQWDLNISRLKDEEKLQKKILAKKKSFKKVFIVGVPRSGTTLLSQILHTYLDFGVFYNLIAKDYLNPLLSLKENIGNIQRGDKSEFKSLLGATSNKFDAHEFGYFWQYWLNVSGSHELDSHEINIVNWSGIEQILSAYSAFLEKGLLIKSIVYTNFIINSLFKHLSDVSFIYIKRDPVFVIQSILESRIKQYGSEDHWWSIKPSDWKKWLNLDPVQQVANQVVYTDYKIQEQLRQIPANNKFYLDFENLIEYPSRYISEISTKFNIIQNREFDIQLNRNANEVRHDSRKLTRIMTSLDKAKEVFL